MEILKHRKSEMDVFDALDGICNLNNIYKYSKDVINIGRSPLDIKDACEAFIGVIYN